MKLHVTAWPTINGEKHQPGDEVEVEDALARMLIRDGQARPAGTDEPRQRGRRGSDHPDLTEPAPKTAAGEASPAEPVRPGKPGRSASKDELAAYAIAQGLDEERARAMSRAELTAHIAQS